MFRKIADGIERRPSLAFLFLIISLFLFRSLVTFPIEHVDAVHKYDAAAKIVRGHGLAPLLKNHHTMRWSEVLPQTAITWATNFSYFGLYLLPLLVFALSSALCWRGLRDALTLPQQCLLLALLFIEPVGLTHTGQLLNPPFGVFYALLAITALSAPKQLRWPHVILAAVLLFASYGAHSTYLAFSAGPVLWLMFWKKKPALATLLVALILALIGAETAFFNNLANYQTQVGRLEAIATGGHMSMVNNRFPTIAVHELFTRWFRLPVFGILVTIGFWLTAAWLWLGRNKRPAAPPFLTLALLTGGGFAIAITFAIVDLDPLRPMMPLRPMYLQPFMPFAILGSAYGFAQLLNGLAPASRRALEIACILVMTGLLFLASQQKITFRDLINERMSAFVWRANTELTDLAGQFRAGQIAIAGRKRWAISGMLLYGQGAPMVHLPEGRLVTANPPTADARCLYTIRRVPIRQNVKECSALELAALKRLRGASPPPETGPKDL